MSAGAPVEGIGSNSPLAHEVKTSELRKIDHRSLDATRQEDGVPRTVQTYATPPAAGDPMRRLSITSDATAFTSSSLPGNVKTSITSIESAQLLLQTQVHTQGGPLAPVLNSFAENE